MKKILLILFLSCNIHEKNTCITSYDLMEKDIAIYGIVKNVYSNKNNRGLTSVDITINSNAIPYNYLYSPRLDQSFYQEVSIGDSLIKHKGFLDIILVKKTGRRKLYLFNCPNVMHDSL